MDPSQLELLKSQALQSSPDAERWIHLAQNISLGANIVYLIIFITTALGLYRLSKALGDKYSWLAFIPLVQIYTYIKTAGYSFWKGFFLLICSTILAGIILMITSFSIGALLYSSLSSIPSKESMFISGFLVTFGLFFLFIFIATFFLFSGIAKRAGQSTGTAILMTLFPWCMLLIVSKRIEQKTMTLTPLPENISHITTQSEEL